MSKQELVDLSIVMRELEVMRKQMNGFEEWLGKIGKDVSVLRVTLDEAKVDGKECTDHKEKSHKLKVKKSADNVEGLTQEEIAKVLVEANIMRPAEQESSKRFLEAIERQVQQKGKETFFEVVSNVSERIAQGGVKNKLGYFRTSMNEAVGR